jgi:nicotinate-nucleotide adenylyltransferase
LTRSTLNIAVFGSAFNPPTRGHKDAIEYVLNHEGPVDAVFLVPAFKHAFAKHMADYNTRSHMVELFVQDINDARVKALCIEHHIKKNTDTPVYTFDVLSHIQTHLYPDAKLSFIIGPDNKANWHRFYKAQEIEKTWSLIEVPERVTVRSTSVRETIGGNLEKTSSEKTNLEIRSMVTPRIASFLKDSGLYSKMQ